MSRFMFLLSHPLPSSSSVSEPLFRTVLHMLGRSVMESLSTQRNLFYSILAVSSKFWLEKNVMIGSLTLTMS